MYTCDVSAIHPVHSTQDSEIFVDITTTTATTRIVIIMIIINEDS